MIQFSHEIFLTTHIGSAMPSYFDVVKESNKAVQLKSQESNRTVWLPKSVLEFSEKFNCFYISDWFRNKLTVSQLSILQG